MSDNRCPRCGGPVDYTLTCHTWPQTVDGRTTWMSCHPCDSAIGWYCLDDDCAWEWTQGLNPRNPRAADNDEMEPAWAT